MSLDLPLVSVGIPTFNRPEGLRRTLECITGQTYANLEIIISDNCSDKKEVESVIEEFAFKDKRIIPFRQTENIGAIKNFQFVLAKANGQFFMWAADDDLWDKEFVSSCVSPLVNNPSLGLSFCNIKNIDSFERVIREYPSFSRFVNNDKAGQITSFILDPEYLGKANIIYGIYRLSVCKKLMTDLLRDSFNTWGADMVFVLGVLLQTDLFIEERCLFFKRLSSPTDNVNRERRIFATFPYLNGIPLDEANYVSYFDLMLKISFSSSYSELIKSLINYRRALTKDIVQWKLEEPSLGIKKLTMLLMKAVSKRILRK